MISNNLADNFKYWGKILIVIIVVFLILKFVVNLKIYEAVLLALIICISILIIENLIYINNIASDPLNCDQCKISISSLSEKIPEINNINNINNIVPNPYNESNDTNVEVEESFTTNEEDNININYDKNTNLDQYVLLDTKENFISNDYYPIQRYIEPFDSNNTPC